MPRRVQEDLAIAKDPLSIERVLRRHSQTLGNPNNSEYAKLMSDVLTERGEPHQILRGWAGEDLTWVHALKTGTHHQPGIDQKRSERFSSRSLYGARTAMVLHRFHPQKPEGPKSLYVDPGAEAHDRIERMRAASDPQAASQMAGREFKGQRTGPYTQKTILEKALVPRDVEEAVAGMSSAEKAFYRQIAILFGSFMITQLPKLLVGKDQAQSVEVLRDQAIKLQSQSEKAAINHTDAVWTLTIRDAEKTWSGARHEDRDYAASQSLLNSVSTGLIPSLNGIAEDTRAELEKIIRQAYDDPAGFNFNKMLKDMEDIVELKRSSIERIARTETTRIANVGRIIQMQKYGDAGELVEWTMANHPRGDSRTCPICKDIASRNPYKISELQALVPHLIAHPNERCTVVRKVL